MREGTGDTSRGGKTIFSVGSSVAVLFFVPLVLLFPPMIEDIPWLPEDYHQDALVDDNDI